ncbi:LytR/AlgR family response regulator transcription factor [Sediminibacterium goheungense]|uniref:LytTR family two component transcriptional regulator n=1 Tax=Sediminibacterium goheungense TaxID=1086393 RepID=A0A4R6IY79_9BACT|nr:LytTR family DNA-binding domain-containing protein [Sediminibacterium goheungense]TDO26835.1 LytTR family two component transcriptional regulator [Sediminibacterium goheungense]
MTILLIDNEISLRNTLKELIKLTGFSFTSIIEASGVKEGIQQIQDANPDIVFLDIEMEDGSGFDLMKKIANPQFQLIFVTAHDQYAIDAFKFSAIDYLLKPVDPDNLKISLEKASANIKTKLLSDQIDVLLQQLSGKTDRDKRIVLRDIDNIYFVKVSDILYCMADGTYTRFYLQNQKDILVSKNLKEYENLLEPLGFLRTHHSYLVNPDKINMYDKSEGGSLILDGGITVPVSQRKKETIISILERKNL